MLVQLIALYALSVVVFIRLALVDNKSYATGEGWRLVGAAIAWPLFHIPWRDFSHRGTHRRHQTHWRAPVTGMRFSHA